MAFSMVGHTLDICLKLTLMLCWVSFSNGYYVKHTQYKNGLKDKSWIRHMTREEVQREYGNVIDTDDEAVTKVLEENTGRSYEWGEWGSTSGCSRTCGAGVQYRKRNCYKTSGRVTSFTSPTLCGKTDRKYQACNKQACEEDDFREQQCAVYNNVLYKGEYYTWIPYRFNGDYTSHFQQCELVCTALDQPYAINVKFSRQVQDGTECMAAKLNGLCVQGKCQPYGCDRNLYSRLVYDECGVCGGEGDTCQQVTRTYNNNTLKLGYNTILTLPLSSQNIDIDIQIEDGVRLAFRTVNNFYLIDDTEHQTSSELVAGTDFTLYLDNNKQSIKAIGPITERVHLIAMSLQPDSAYLISYSFIIPRKSANIVSTDRKISSTNRKLRHHNHPLSPRYKHIRKDPADTSDDSISNNVDSVNKNNDVKTSQVVNRKRLPKSQRDSKTIKKTAKILANNTENKVKNNGRNGKKLNKKKESASNSIQSTDNEQNTGISEEYYKKSNGNVSNKRKGNNKNAKFGGYQSSGKPLLNVEGVAVSESAMATSTIPKANSVVNGAENIHSKESNAVDLTGGHDTKAENNSASDKYRWKVDMSDCSQTCSPSGMQYVFTQCVDSSDKKVDENLCDLNKKPRVTTQQCGHNVCQPRWVSTHWSHCTSSCGEGYQYRTVRCWRVLSPGLDSSVHNDMCAHLPKPDIMNKCHNIACGEEPEWVTSEWSQCSVPCGPGLSTRSVTCNAGPNRCDLSQKPASSHSCKDEHCDGLVHWVVSKWSTCPYECGIQHRSISCRSMNGSDVGDVFCVQARRPLTVNVCGDKRCEPKWVPQDWDECSEQCGSGTIFRQIVCGQVEKGEFLQLADADCKHLPMPHSASSCRGLHCPGQYIGRWYSGQWSQCSQSCGIGIKTRLVNCYRDNQIQMMSSQCNPLTKPDTTEPCDLAPCDSPETECVDDPRITSCSLVIQHNLCTHYYYRKACCKSCNQN